MVQQKVAPIFLQLPAATKSLVGGLDPEWANCLSSVLRLEKFHRLAEFVDGERRAGKVAIFPPSNQVSL